MVKMLFLLKISRLLIYSRQFNALYHSRHGALTETNHVFIEAGLCKALEEKKRFTFLRLGLAPDLLGQH
jgi:tRNA U34 5-methylaminomethyl-2-thiouridine-forming methyltransferase MnmC